MGLNYSPKIITSGLVLYLDAANPKSYPGTGTVWTDLTGNGNNGTLANGAIYANNPANITLDGVNDIISIPDSNILDFGTADFTVSCFIYAKSTPLSANAEFGIINKNITYQNSAGWGVEVSTWGKSSPYEFLNIYFYNTGQTVWGNTNVEFNSFKTDVWNNVVATRSSSSGKIYINGTLAVEKTNSDMALNVNNTSAIIIGDHSWGPTFNGNIALISMYNRALSSDEVLQNFNALKGRFNL